MQHHTLTYNKSCVPTAHELHSLIKSVHLHRSLRNSNVRYRVHRSMYEGWNFNSGNYLFTTDTK